MTRKFLNVQRWCVLTLEPYRDEQGYARSSSGVEGAHVIPASISAQERAKLERIVGVDPGKLMLENPLNIIPLRGDWHMGYDGGQWILLPHHPVLLAIAEGFAKGNNPIRWGDRQCTNLNFELHHYQFVPFGQRAKSVPLFRRKFEDPALYDRLVEDDCDIFSPPDFDQYPVIRSTAHPYAIIWKAVYEFGERELVDLHPSHITSMMTAQGIVALWKSRFKQPLPTLPQPGSGPDADGQHRSPAPSTGSRRWSRGKRDDHGQEHSTPTGHPSSEEPAGQDSEWLADTPSDIASSHYDFTPPPLPDREVWIDEKSVDEQEHRPSSLAAYSPPDVDAWRKVSQDSPVHVIINRESSPFVYNDATPLVGQTEDYQEKAATPPAGDWTEWSPEYLRRIGQDGVRQLLEEYAMHQD